MTWTPWYLHCPEHSLSKVPWCWGKLSGREAQGHGCFRWDVARVQELPTAAAGRLKSLAEGRWAGPQESLLHILRIPWRLYIFTHKDAYSVCIHILLDLWLGFS